MGRPSLWMIGVALLIVAGALVWWRAAPSAVQTATSDHARRPEQVAPSHIQPVPLTVPRAPVSSNPPAAVPDAPAADDEVMQPSWEAVNLDDVRKALPDNSYWQLAAPTKDPQIVEWREAERDRWNVEYGKVLSGTGSEEEIKAYYDHRARVSTDYIEFATYLLDHYGEQLPEQGVEMLKLARQLHLARLEEIPRRAEEAFERKRTQDAAREAWLADQKDFGAAATDE